MTSKLKIVASKVASSALWRIPSWGLAFLMWFLASSASAGIDFSQPFRSFNSNAPGNPYGLTDLDEIDPGPYLYTRWGVYLGTPSTIAPPTVTIGFDNLTRGPFSYKNKDLFISSSLASLNRVALPDVAPASTQATWLSPGTDSNGYVNYIMQSPVFADHWFRKLHFANSLNVFSEQAAQRSVSADDRKLIVLIHGWNPDGGPDMFVGEFQQLVDNIYSQIQNHPDWQLVLYHWEADADTGPVFAADVAINGSEAAEAAYQHGKHLGELLLSLSPNLEKIHLISHSAGAWAARSTAKFLFDHAPNPAALPVVEVTLLDPFIPDQVPGVLTLQTSNLTKAKMDQMPLFAANAKIFRLENYFSVDGTPGTDVGNFAWNNSRDINRQVNWVDVIDGLAPKPYYGNGDINLTKFSGHFGPILFYSDTAAAYSAARTLATALANPAINLETDGWGSSLFLNELIIDQPPQSNTGAVVGQPVTFSVHAKTRREQLNFDSLGYQIRYVWQKFDEATGTWITAYGSNGTDTYARSSPIADEAGLFRVVVDNGTGEVSAEFTLGFANASGSPFLSITSPLNGATLANSVDVSVQAAASVDRVEFFVDGVSKASISAAPFGWTWNTASASNGSHTITAKAFGGLVESLLGYAPPVEVQVANSSSPPPADADANEPNDSSLQATALDFGVAGQGRISSPTDVDWFKVNVTAPGQLAFNLMVPGDKDFDLELYGPDGAYLTGSYNGIGLSESITYNASSTGTYFARIYGYPAGSGSFSVSEGYSLTVNLTSGVIKIVSAPQNVTVPWGASASFQVVASIDTNSPLSYQWYRNGSAIPGATAATYYTPPAALLEDGNQFAVQITSAFGVITTPAATLTVANPTSNTWTGAISNDWNEPLNWDQGHLPNGSEVARIYAGAPLASNLSSSTTVISGGSLTLLGNLNGAVTVASGGTLIFDGTNEHGMYGTLTNAGTVIVQGSGALRAYNGGGAITNLAGGLFDLRSNVPLTGYYYSNAWFLTPFTNAGTLRKSAGTATDFSYSLTNTGTVDVQTGTISFDALATSAGTISASAGAGVVVADGITLQDGSAFVGEGNIQLNSTVTGQINGTGLVSTNLSGTCTINGSLTLLGPGNLNGALTVASGGTLIFDGTNEHGMYGTLTNAGTVIVQGSGALRAYNGGGAITNLAGGLFDLRSDAPLDGSYDLNDQNYKMGFANAGILRKSAGTTTAIDYALTNTGTVDVQTGTLDFDVDVTLQDGSSFGGAGTSALNGTVTGPINGTGLVLTRLNGTCTINGTLTLLGNLTGAVTVASGGTLIFDGANEHGMYGTLTNAGTVIVQGSGALRAYNGGGAITNLAGGLFDLRSDAPLAGHYYFNDDILLTPFTNAGTLRKSAEAATDFSYALTNTGTVDVQTGTISFDVALSNTGTLSIGSGAGITVAGQVYSAPSFTNSPQGQSVSTGSNATFSVVAIGFPVPSYQWQRRALGAVEFSNLSDDGIYSGTITPTLVVSSVTQLMNGGQFRCIASNGFVPSAVSDPATLLVNSAFSSWAASYFTAGELADASRSGPTAVYGSDGLPNLVKYALGLDPKQNVTAALPSLTTTATDWVYTYTRPSNITDVTYVVEMSTDLSNWTAEGVTHTKQSTANGIDTWTTTYPLSSASTIFFRLRVTLP